MWDHRTVPVTPMHACSLNSRRMLTEWKASLLKIDSCTRRICPATSTRLATSFWCPPCSSHAASHRWVDVVTKIEWAVDRAVAVGRGGRGRLESIKNASSSNSLYILRVGLQYGAVPVVRRTGGLADTVFDVDGAENADKKNGFVFDGVDEASLDGALDRALDYYNSDPAFWAELMKKNMAIDNSWAKSAAAYVNMYRTM
eukprot:1180685-Prorocentrum_minimum.AAC.1